MLEKQRVITKSSLKDNSQIQIKRLDIHRAFFYFFSFNLHRNVNGFLEKSKNNNPTKKVFDCVFVQIYRYQILSDV